MSHSDAQHTERCPDCTVEESAVPIITIDGTTLWRCTNESCSGVRWRTENHRTGLRENPDPRTIERLLNGAAEYWDEDAVQELADDIARLYRESRTADETRKAERISCPQ